MAYSDVLAACPNIQTRIDDAFVTPGMFPGADERMPLAEFIVSPANRSGLQQSINPSKGKLRTVEVVYDQRILESAVAVDQPNPNCAGTGTRGNGVEEYSLDITKNLQVTEAIELTDFTGACDADSDIMARKVAAMVDVLDRRLATQIAVQTALLGGKWGASVPNVNVSDQLVINTLLAGTSNPNPDALIEVKNAAEDSGFPSDLLIVGGQDMRTYMQRMMAGCCAQYGLDLGELMAQFGYAFAYDKRLADATAQDEFMVIAPRALQLLEFSIAEGKGELGEIWNQSSNYFYTTVRSPRFGVTYDLSGKDPCGTLALALTFTGKMVGMPTDIFGAGDEYEGVTYAANGLVTNV